MSQNKYTDYSEWAEAVTVLRLIGRFMGQLGGPSATTSTEDDELLKRLFRYGVDPWIAAWVFNAPGSARVDDVGAIHFKGVSSAFDQLLSMVLGRPH